MTKPDIIICPDAAELNRRAAERFVALANEASAGSGRFTVALSGGSTPVKNMHAYRLTLTLPVLNHAANVFFLVAGASKAAVVKELLGTHPTIAKFAAQRIQPVDGALIWFITRDAAAELPTL